MREFLITVTDEVFDISLPPRKISISVRYESTIKRVQIVLVFLSGIETFAGHNMKQKKGNVNIL